MRSDIRTAVYDQDLKIEACCFKGTRQTFPNHFHEHYVIGFVEEGKRLLSCKNKEYAIEKGCVVLFNPGDNHGCVQADDGTLDYRNLQISRETMADLANEVTGRPALPLFSSNVIYDEEVSCYLRSLHEMVMNRSAGFGKEETLLFLISALIKDYCLPDPVSLPECGKEVLRACEFMEEHYRERICLDDICRQAHLSKPALLRAFTRTKGITPYRYLENIRINQAKKLLEQGAAPLDAAIGTGFSDQSHFTNYFTSFIGLSPGAYRDIFCSRDKEDISHEQ